MTIEASRFFDYVRLVRDLSQAAFENLARPASESDAVDLSRIARHFPEFLTEILRCFDGELRDSGASIFPNGMRLMACRHIRNVCTYNAARTPDIADSSDLITCIGDVKRVLFNPARIPFAHRNHEVFWSVDFDPPVSGVLGQIVFEDVENGVLAVVADSFVDLMDRMIADLMSGEISEDENGWLSSEIGPWLLFS